MKSKWLMAGLLTGVFTLGIAAGDRLKPNGFWWSKIPESRQLGFYEGFSAGYRFRDTSAVLCQSSLRAQNPTCILEKWYGDSLLDLDTGEVLEVLKKFYADPKNLPVTWEHAIVISKAIASGVPLDEKELEAVREWDAKNSVK